MNLPDIELVSAKVHEAWMESKAAQGVTTRKSETGEELIAPYASLSEPAKDLDRGTVRAVYAAIEALATAPAVPDGRTEDLVTVDVGVSGPINGMDEPDLSGSYMRLTVNDQRYKLSIGATEILAAELAGLLDAQTVPDEMTEEVEKLTAALKIARQFISNGVELGFIRMPDRETPDPAHDTLSIIEAALSPKAAVESARPKTPGFVSADEWLAKLERLDRATPAPETAK